MVYLPRIIDTRLDALMSSVPAVAVDGAKAVGKTASASRLANSALQLDDPDTLRIVQADRALVNRLDRPVLVDEWQLDPPTWDAVRRSVDNDFSPGHFILTGSANPRESRVHSGAGRFVRVLMRPLSLAERGITQPQVSLRQL